MALTKKDLQAIKEIVDESISGVKTDVSSLKTDVSSLKTDVSSLKTDVSSLKTDVSSLKTDVSSLKTDVADLKTRMTRVEDDLTEVKTRMTKVEDDLTEVKVVMLENTLIPKVNDIAAYQKSVYERYTRDADRFEEKITTIDVMETTVTDHSKQIQELQLKQA
jgi:chromosome segregation ATPase